MKNTSRRLAGSTGMPRRFGWLILLGVVVLIAASCGGDDSADTTGDSNDPTEQDDGSGGSSDGSGSSGDGTAGDPANGGDGGGSDGAPELDPNDMPNPGEIVLELDGETFSVSADDVEFYTCEIGADFVNVRAESATENWTVQVDPVAGLANASLRLEDAGISYNSFTRPDVTGGFVVEAPYIVYEASFDVTDLDDPISADAVGPGRVEVTCP